MCSSIWPILPLHMGKKVQAHKCSMRLWISNKIIFYLELCSMKTSLPQLVKIYFIEFVQNVWPKQYSRHIQYTCMDSLSGKLQCLGTQHSLVTSPHHLVLAHWMNAPGIKDKTNTSVTFRLLKTHYSKLWLIPKSLPT